MTAVRLDLSHDEALVMFEWLASWPADSQGSATPPAEHIVFWTLEAQLERVLTEPLKENYARLVAEARKRIVAGYQA